MTLMIMVVFAFQPAYACGLAALQRWYRANSEICSLGERLSTLFLLLGISRAKTMTWLFQLVFYMLYFASSRRLCSAGCGVPTYAFF
ncbi:uncharacterized protein BO66DRAFT_250772 [Aspergillus aculeatinus CBS 121060]|uniref:Uncharacterized protein n=1 Tax=Aspergillus aculeatinus CBS 121060 TaxID=1448322 RepID=A0ACD1HH54_9EURO|nr:hypothetical protein BO66DRAFT_250772 [Aspergillus aculeatinus CBS 121060]RAH72920.1 hypothetical protein BO66DRAFT_250772 [Aspergillus aculeatinus CBS 121060]